MLLRIQIVDIEHIFYHRFQRHSLLTYQSLYSHIHTSMQLQIAKTNFPEVKLSSQLEISKPVASVLASSTQFRIVSVLRQTVRPPIFVHEYFMAKFRARFP